MLSEYEDIFGVHLQRAILFDASSANIQSVDAQRSGVPILLDAFYQQRWDCMHVSVSVRI
jgi:hypothetical protein